MAMERAHLLSGCIERGLNRSHLFSIVQNLDVFDQDAAARDWESGVVMIKDPRKPPAKTDRRLAEVAAEIASTEPTLEQTKVLIEDTRKKINKPLNELLDGSGRARTNVINAAGLIANLNFVSSPRKYSFISRRAKRIATFASCRVRLRPSPTS